LSNVIKRPSATRALAGCLGAATALTLGVGGGGVAAAAPAYGVLNCSGNLTKLTPTVDDPNLTGYAFQCTQDIASYTLVVNRQGNDLSTLDDLSPTADVFDPSHTTISSTETVGCQGTTPGNGLNCFAQSSTKPVAITTTNWVQGTFDTTDPFCSNIPAGSKPGTKAEPSAFVQLIVSDLYGNEFGPFRLNRKPACPPSPKAKPVPKKAKSKHGHKPKHKK
jgi:hypothetical protein